MTRSRGNSVSILSVLILPAFLVLALAGCRDRPVPGFDESRAFQDLEKQMTFGPRIPGSPGNRACRDWLVGELEKSGAKVELQTFADTIHGQPVELSNVRARFGPTKGTWIVLGAHWDTRAMADRDPDPAKQGQPVPGANDGASGVAVLLEVARAFAAAPPPVGVEIVLFDGEDQGRSEEVQGFCRGSRYYVKQLKHPWPALALVVDLVGDKKLELYYEQNSHHVARNIVERIWSGAKRVNAPAFVPETRHNVYDDHAPFIEAGIPGIDLIDFDYPAWHTTGDDLTQVSPQSLGQVGRVVLWYVYTSEWDAAL